MVSTVLLVFVCDNDIEKYLTEMSNKKEKKQQQKYQDGIDSRWIDFVNKFDCFESYNLMVS